MAGPADAAVATLGSLNEVRTNDRDEAIVAMRWLAECLLGLALAWAAGMGLMLLMFQFGGYANPEGPDVVAVVLAGALIGLATFRAIRRRRAHRKSEIESHQ